MSDQLIISYRIMRIGRIRRLIRTVSPAKATLAPVFSFERSIELEAGAEIPNKIMLEHDTTAEDIEA
jgi:hypothetical protein